MGSILKVRDENGNFIDITAIKGDEGKSAYEHALAGGFIGTEEEFNKAIADLSPSVTPEMIGAMPASKYIYNVDVLSITKDGWYFGGSLTNAPSSSGYLQVSGYGNLEEYRVIKFMPASSATEYINVMNGGTWTGWAEMLTTADALASLGITATATELNYVDGVTSNIQTQLNAKAASSHNHSASNITSGTLPVTRGGTAITSNPSMLINLGSTSAASVFATSPRPGVTGTLPITRGGTGATNAVAALANLGGARVAFGSYAGHTGAQEYGKAYATTLSFDFAPTLVWIYACKNDKGSLLSTTQLFNGVFAINIPSMPTTAADDSGFGMDSMGYRSADGKTITWYNGTSTSYQLCQNGYTYYWVAIA